MSETTAPQKQIVFENGIDGAIKATKYLTDVLQVNKKYDIHDDADVQAKNLVALERIISVVGLPEGDIRQISVPKGQDVVLGHYNDIIYDVLSMLAREREMPEMTYQELRDSVYFHVEKAATK
jgi:hypothetical protein